MSSGGLLLLLGLLTLWAELTPVSGQDRPNFCSLPPVIGPCKANMTRFYYNPASKQCQQFVYGGCYGNANNFETKDGCHFTCIEKPGGCPQGLAGFPCEKRCDSDWKCPKAEKCCHYGCLSQCQKPYYASPVEMPTPIGPTVRT